MDPSPPPSFFISGCLTFQMSWQSIVGHTQQAPQCGHVIDIIAIDIGRLDFFFLIHMGYFFIQDIFLVGGGYTNFSDHTHVKLLACDCWYYYYECKSFTFLLVIVIFCKKQSPFQGA